MTGRGHAPYPASSSLARSACMRGNRRAGTKPEMKLRSFLHRRGLRFRKDMRLDLPGGRVRPDIVFTRAKLAIFVDGCFWHGCPEHSRPPSVNRWYWVPKLQQNRDRDERNDEALRGAGWQSIRVWEHEPVGAAARRIEGAYFEALASLDKRSVGESACADRLPRRSSTRRC